METPHKYSEEELTEILKKLSAEGDAYGSILRAKGIVPAVENGSTLTWFQGSMKCEEEALTTLVVSV